MLVLVLTRRVRSEPLGSVESASRRLLAWVGNKTGPSNDRILCLRPPCCGDVGRVSSHSAGTRLGVDVGGGEVEAARKQLAHDSGADCRGDFGASHFDTPRERVVQCGLTGPRKHLSCIVFSCLFVDFRRSRFGSRLVSAVDRERSMISRPHLRFSTENQQKR